MRIDSRLPLLLGLGLAFTGSTLAQESRSGRPPLTPPPDLPDVKGPAPTLTAPHLRSTPTRPHSAHPVDRGVRRNDPFQTPLTPQRKVDRLFIDQPEGGEFWVRGRTYKARFGPDRVDYIPFLGSDAPRNFPVGMKLLSAEVDGEPLPFETDVQATREGDSLSYSRGVLVERYLLELESVEQTFVFHDAIAGDIALRVGVTTDLTPTEVAEGFAFTHALGSVHVTDAVAIDAKGTRLDLVTEWDGQAFTLRVPADFTANAAYPLTIDPIVSTFDIDTFSADLSFPMTTYDPGTDSFLVVYKEAFSATDGDIYATQIEIDGTFVHAGYVDVTSDRWVNPDTACIHSDDSFLVVAKRDMGPGTASSIYGRIWTPSTGSQGSQFEVSSTFGNESAACIGGDPFDNYLVVYEREYTTNDHDILGQLVTSSGNVFGGVIQIANNGADDYDPFCSKFSGAQPASTSTWAVTWHRDNAGVSEIWAAELLYDGSITHSAYEVYGSSLNAYYPHVSSPLEMVGDRTFLVTFNVSFGSDLDVFGAAIQGGSVLTTENLSVGGLPGSFLNDEFNPRAESNGMRFVMGWNDGQPPGILSNHVSTVALTAGELCVTETATLSATGNSWPTDIAASTEPALDPDYLVVIYDTTASNGNITGAHYDDYWGCVGAEFCAVSTATNSSGLWGQIYGLGSGVAGDTLTLYAQRLPANQFGYFLVSRTSGNISPPGSQGTLCLSGNIGRFNSQVQNSGAHGRIQITIDTDFLPLNPVVGALPGETFRFQAWYRDVNPSATSNFTDGLRITFQ